MVDSDFRESEGGNAPPKKGQLTTIIISALIAFVIGGGGGFFAGKIVSRREQINHAAPTGNEKTSLGEARRKPGGEIPDVYTVDEASGKTGGEIGQGPQEKRRQGLLPLETFTVNLNDPFGKRYAECDLNLVLNDRTLVPRIKANALVMAKIRHEIFMTISAKSYGDLKSTAGKITLFEEIQMRVNEILKEQIGVEPVLEVLQTRFLMQ
ncbi:MAG: flagellar basal body-associated FliL family protein [Candidatus Aminicenantes bacterium]|jgi:flagellar basal body-associated protein FliL